MPRIENIDEFERNTAKEIEKLETIEEMAKYLSKFDYAFFLNFRSYLRDEEKINMINIAGDLRIKNVLDKHPQYFYANDFFETKYLFFALDIRIEEKSKILNQKKYTNMLSKFKHECLMDQYKIRKGKVRMLVRN